MWRTILRSFAAGILFTAGVIAISYYKLGLNTPQKTETKKEEKPVITEQSVNQYLSAHNLVAIPKEDLEKKQQKTNQTQPNSNDKKEEAGPAAYDLVISEGMTSADIASSLKKAGMIEDQNQFVSFLSDNGYDRKIQIGHFQIIRTMSYREIAELITK